MNKAILLLGPTGIGKSPLGRLLERRGLLGRRCFHFDFGANLRAVAASFEGRAAGDRKTDVFSLRQRALILNSLATGALLEDDDFPIAAKILNRFIVERCVRPEDLLVMNGLPRHAGQARRLKDRVAVRAVVELDGTAAVIAGRIRNNAGGDRAGRADDTREAIQRRLEIYEKRTRPLIEFYARRDVPIISFAVGAKTTAGEIYEKLERRTLLLE